MGLTMPTLNRGTLAALLGVAAFAGIAFGCLGGGLAGYRMGRAPADGDADRAGPPAAGPAARAGVLSRKDFEAAVRGKTRDQIIAAVGRPDDTRTQREHVKALAGPGLGYVDLEWWVFRGRVANDATGRPYPEARVRFGEGDRADLVEYP